MTGNFLSLSEHKHSDRPNTSLIGERGEELAAHYLIRRGFRLVAANFKVPIGRNIRGAAVTGEIDIIALENKTLCFVEVKTRSSAEYAAPLSAINLRKQRQIIRTARVYRKIFNVRPLNFRYDAVSVILPDSGKPEIELVRNFWTEDKFRKKFWNSEFL